MYYDETILLYQKATSFYEIKHTIDLILVGYIDITISQKEDYYYYIRFRMRDKVKSMFTRSIVRVHYW